MIFQKQIKMNYKIGGIQKDFIEGIQTNWKCSKRIHNYSKRNSQVVVKKTSEQIQKGFTEGFSKRIHSRYSIKNSDIIEKEFTGDRKEFTKGDK